jgi:porphobilinogen synthase
MIIRHRRLRNNEGIRNMVKDVSFSLDNFIYPLFIIEGTNIFEEIPSMPDQYRFSLDKVDTVLDELNNLGIKNLLLFGIPKNKDPLGSEAYNPKGIIQESIRAIKKINKDISIITDICMCEYTSHGHCGIIENNRVDNDKTLEYLGKIALSHAESGIDIVAPSDMMDGRIGYIRKTLDEKGFTNLPIMAYSIKYASAYYGPFRDAAESTPQFGDRKDYQMDFRRKKEPLSEAIQDIKEGADIIMVKPALAYLDIIKNISDNINVPVAAYNVSGEYAMVKAASRNNWIDEKRIIIENIYAIRRAGASIIISYHTKEIAKWIKEGSI